MAAYRPEDWADLYVAVVGAAAVLTGLLFTALSLGPQHLLQTPEHRGRAREALFQLMAVLVFGLCVLVPAQGNSALGIEVLLVFTVMTTASARYQMQTIRSLPADQRPRWVLRVFVPDLATLAVGVAGISIVLEAGGGLYWLFGAALIYILWSFANAWQLMASKRADADDN